MPLRLFLLGMSEIFRDQGAQRAFVFILDIDIVRDLNGELPDQGERVHGVRYAR